MQLLYLQIKKRYGILSNLQPDNSIHVTHPDKGRIALMLNKSDYYWRVNAILSDTYK